MNREYSECVPPIVQARMEALDEESDRAGWEAYAARNNAAWFAPDLVANLTLPGHAYAPRESCGEFRLVGCLEPGHPGQGKKIKWNCNSRHCRMCWKAWCQMHARSVTDRLMAGLIRLTGPSHTPIPHKRRLLHMIVSIPPDARDVYLTMEGRKKLRTEARDRLLSVMDRCDGGVMIDHAYRFTEDLQQAIFSPHFHFILSGWFNMDKNTEEYLRTGGFLIKYVDNLEEVSDVYGEARYILSHSSSALGQPGERHSEQTLRYFGEFSNNKYGTEEVLSNASGSDEKIFSKLGDHITPGEMIKSVELRPVTMPPKYEDARNGTTRVTTDPGAVQELIRSVHKAIIDYPAWSKSRTEEGMRGYCFYLHIRVNYDKRSIDLLVKLDPSLDNICQYCTRIYRLLHYVGPPDEKFFESLPVNVTVDIPSDMKKDWDYEDERRKDGVYLGVQYFDVNGEVKTDFGGFGYPVKEKFNPVIRKIIYRRVFHSQYVEYQRGINEKPDWTQYWDLVGIAEQPTIDDDRTVPERLSNFPGLLDEYHKAVQTVE